VTRYLGVDLAWGEGTERRVANESGVVCIDETGTVIDAGWAVGIDAVVSWILATAEPGSVIAVDAPLLVENATGMRRCEREVGQRYGRWQVSAYPSNLGLPALGGVALFRALEAAGLHYFDGLSTPAPGDIVFFEAYPHTTLVGAEELGYTEARPRYKKLDTSLPVTERRQRRADVCDDLIERLDRLATASPPLLLRSHPVTTLLLDVPSPTKETAHKHREDLIDAALCAWTASSWDEHGLERFQILGATDVPDDHGRVPTLLAMARPEQRHPDYIPPNAYESPASLPREISAIADDPARAEPPSTTPEGHMNKQAYTKTEPATADAIEFVEGGAAGSMTAASQPSGSTRAPSPAPTTVDLLRSATWHLEHARVTAAGDDVAFEAARSALAEAVFDLEAVQYGESTRG
jgi:predicted RNase H-like nuclease